MRRPALRHLVDVPIYAKVSLAPGLILLILLALSLFSLRIQQANESDLRAITERAFPTYQRAAETKDAVSAIQTALQHTLSVAANESDPARIRKVAQPVHAAIARAATALDRLQQQLDRQAETVAGPREAFAAYQAAAAEVLEAALSDSATATMLMAGVDEAFGKLSTELGDYETRADAASQRLTQAALRVAASERLLLLSGLGVAIVVGAGIILVTARAIGGPIVRLTTRMASMADDDLDPEIPDLGRGDEIGAMARAVDVFRLNGLQAHHHRAERERGAGHAGAQPGCDSSSTRRISGRRFRG